MTAANVDRLEWALTVACLVVGAALCLAVW